MSDISYDTVVRGFDSIVSESEDNDGYARVELLENGKKVYMVDIPMIEGEEFNSSDVIDRITDSAIDLFESQRGTLGQGAGVMNKTNNSKTSYYTVIRDHEEWFRGIQGTPYEDGAIQILEKKLDLQKEEKEKEDQISEYRKVCDKLLVDMDELDLERIKSTNGYKDQIIVIKAEKVGNFYSADEVKEYLDIFKGHELEPLVLNKMKEYLDLKSQMDAINKDIDSIYEQREDLDKQMQELTIMAVESAMSNNVNVEMLEYPNMAGDIADLMDGVELDDTVESSPIGEVPMDPMEEDNENIFLQAKSARELSGVDEEILQGLKGSGGFIPKDECQHSLEDMGKLQAEMLVRLVNHSGPYENSNRDEFFVYEITPYGEKALETKVSFQISAEKEDKKDKDEDTELKVDELGEFHDGLQPAEVEPDGMPFNEGEKIELIKPVEIALWGGKITYEKGTKGTIDSLFDRHGDYYKVMTEKGKLIKVKWDQMKRTKKNKKDK